MISVFHVSQTHAAVGHGEKYQDCTVDTVFQQKATIPDLLQGIYQLELEMELPHVGKQADLQQQADHRQPYIDQTLKGFPFPQSVFIIITVCIQNKLLLYSAFYGAYRPEAEMPGTVRH